MPVGSKNSCGAPVVEVQKAAEAFPAPDPSTALPNSVLGQRLEDHVAQPLVVAFVVVVGKVLAECCPYRELRTPAEGAFAARFFHSTSSADFASVRGDGEISTPGSAADSGGIPFQRGCVGCRD